MLHVWHIYLHLGDFWANVGKYSIHGAYGIEHPPCFTGYRSVQNLSAMSLRPVIHGLHGRELCALPRHGRHGSAPVFSKHRAPVLQFPLGDVNGREVETFQSHRIKPSDWFNMLK